MKLKFPIFTCIAFLVFASQINAEPVVCNYMYVKELWELGRAIYTCNVDNLKDFGGLTINFDKVITYSQNDKKVVEGFQVENAKTLNYFPTNVGQLFPNIIMVNIRKSKLIEITSDDLKQFPKLKMLYIFNNLLEYIPEDLFIHNPNISVIDFERNEIQHIDPKVFSSLNQLRALDLRINTCNNFDKAENRNQVEKLVKKVEEGKCQSDKYKRFKKKILLIAKLREELMKEENQKEILIVENEKLQNQITKFHASVEKHCNNEKLMIKLKELEERVVKFAKSNSECEFEFENIKTSLDEFKNYATEIKDTRNMMQIYKDSLKKSIIEKKNFENQTAAVNVGKPQNEKKPLK